MLTRCPQCGTTFRVTREQLKARQGRVRCGACQGVFDALDALVEEVTVVAPASTAAGVASEPAASSVSDEPAGVDVSPLETAFAEPVSAGLPPIEPSPDAPKSIPAALGEEELSPVAPAVEPEPVALEQVAVEAAAVEPGPAEPIVAPMPEPAAATALAAEPEFASELELPPLAVPRRRTWLWALGVFVAVGVIAVQAAIHFRTEIVVLYPETKATLAAACATLGCDLALPRKASLVGIETSDLSPDAGGKLTLAATLKNRAPFAQEFPHLELTLTDTADRALVRRVLAPADYLPPQTLVAAGFGANAELAVNLVVEAPGVPAAGYRLYLFYP